MLPWGLRRRGWCYRSRQLHAACRRVPAARHTVSPHPIAPGNLLQEYVRARVQQFSQALAERLLGPAELAAARGPPDRVAAATEAALRALPPPDYAALPLEQRELQLFFRHDCV